LGAPREYYLSEHTEEETPFRLVVPVWCRPKPSFVRINRWNGREDRQKKTAGVVEGVDRAKGNFRCVGGRGLAEGNF